MKLITQCILLLALLTGCQKENVEATKNGGELSFNLTVDGMLPVDSRAVSDMPDFNTHGFDIAGYGTTNRFEENVIDSPTAKLPTPNLFGLNIDMIAVPHIDKQPDGSFRSPLSKIPLLEGTYLSFFAWSQNKLRDKVSGIVESTDDETDKGFPYLKILVPDAPQSQFDIVAARSTNHENDYVISAVDLDFNHILSKLTFRATSSTRNQVKIESVKINYGANKVYRGGTFTFASSGVLLGSYGSYNSYHSGQHSLGTSFADISNGSTSALGDMLLMPQSLADDFASIDITYRITLFDKAEQQVTKSVPIKAITLEYGKNYIFTLNITATEILMSVGSIGNWIDGDNSPSLPMIAGPRGDVMLLLDGKDAPYTQGNKKYWLDRSGYNRHCEIIGNVTYNSADKAYVFNNSDKNYVLVPAMGYLTAATIQLVTSTPGGSDQTAFYFSGQSTSTLTNNRILFTHLNYKDQVITYFDAGDFSGGSPQYDRVNTTANDITIAQYQAYSLYTFRKGVPFMGFSRNDNYHLTANNKARPVGSATYNKIGWSYAGNIKYFKLTQRSITAAEMSADYADLKTRCNLPDDPPPTANELLPPVRDGLILCLDGRSGIENVKGENVWKDQSPLANHAVIFGTVPHNINRFTFPGTKGNYMKLLNTLGKNQAYTFECVLRANNTTANTTVVHFSSADNTQSGRQFSSHYPWGKEGIWFDSAWYGQNDTDKRLNIPDISVLTNEITDVNQWQVVRQTNVPNIFAARTDGKVVVSRDATAQLQEMFFNYIGCFADKTGSFGGDIYSLRMYNRVLTEAELNSNLDSDRTIRNIPY